MSIPTPATLAKMHPRKPVSSPTSSSEESVSSTKQPPVEQVESPTSTESQSSLSSRVTSVAAENGRQSSKPTKTKSSSSSGNPSKKKDYVRPEHLTQRPLREHEGLQRISEELHEMEDINKDAGWYDRDKNGKQHAKRDEDIQKTADFLKGLVADEFLIEVGGKAASILKISKIQLVKALDILKGQGYKIYFVPTDKTYEKVNVTTGEKKIIKVAMKVLAAPGTSFQTVFAKKDEVFLATEKRPAPKGPKKPVKKRPARPTRKNVVLNEGVIEATEKTTPLYTTNTEPQEDILNRLEENLGINKENN